MDSNFCFPEVVGVAVSLFGTRGDEEGCVEWGAVVLLFSQRWMRLAGHNQNPSDFPKREPTDWQRICFHDSFQTVWGVTEICTYRVRADQAEHAYKCEAKALHWIKASLNSVCFSVFIVIDNPDLLPVLSQSNRLLFILFLVRTTMSPILMSYKHNKHETPTRAQQKCTRAYLFNLRKWH